MVVSVSMELEHTYLKQRGKSFKAHEFWNLTEATPWGMPLWINIDILVKNIK